MQTRLVREELQKCWRTEGVNHYEVCHHLTAKYLDMLRENRVSFFMEVERTNVKLIELTFFSLFFFITLFCHLINQGGRLQSFRFLRISYTG